MLSSIRAFGTKKGKENTQGELFVDTGCSDHLCSDRSCLVKPDQHKPVRIPIETANGMSIAESQGPAIFTVQDSKGEHVKLERTVLFCPNLSVNLFSPSKDFEIYGTKVEFNDQCILTLRNGTKIPFQREDNTYKLRYKVNSDTAHAGLRKSDETIQEPRHRRLGQVPPKVVQTPTGSVREFGDRIHMDLAGPIEKSINGGYEYASTFIDSATLHISVYCLRTRNDQATTQKGYIADMAMQGGAVKEFYPGNGGEYISNDYIALIRKSGARKTTIVPRSPNMIPTAENTFWNLFAMVRAMLNDSGMPNIHWPKAIYQAAYILNRIPGKKKGVSPFEALRGRKPELRHIKTFGCLAYGLKPTNDRTSKLGDVKQVGYHMGISQYQKGWILFIPDKDDSGNGKYKAYQTVQFNESIL